MELNFFPSLYVSVYNIFSIYVGIAGRALAHALFMWHRLYFLMTVSYLCRSALPVTCIENAGLLSIAAKAFHF
jgi:hypothetical protein